MESQFLFMGCWNQNQCGIDSTDNGVSSVMFGMKRHVEDHRNVDFIIVGGDNYYPRVIKKDAEKKKYVNEDELLSGFTCLSDIPIPKIILFGNHDMEQTQMYSSDDTALPACHVLDKQIEIMDSYHHMSYDTYQGRTVFIWNTCIIVLVDTTLYVEDTSKYEECYLKKYDGLTIEKVKKQKQTIILKELDECMRMIPIPPTTMYIIGHHPILGLKALHKVDTINEDFITLLFEINRLCGIPITYLCADVHNYQYTEMTIQHQPTQTDLIVHQYIVGTGGTELDAKIDQDDLSNIYTISSYAISITSHHQELSFGFIAVSSIHPPVFYKTKEPIVKEKKEKKEVKEKKGIRNRRMKSKRRGTMRKTKTMRKS
jgi:hypothetical protein